MRSSVAALLLSASLSVSAANMCFGPTMAFYDELRYPGQDGDSNADRYFKLGDVDVIYQSEFTYQASGTSTPASATDMPTQASVESACAGASSAANLVIIDIEHFDGMSWATADAADFAFVKASFQTILGWCSPQLDTYQSVGIYSGAPAADYYNAIDGDGDAGYELWQAANDAMNFLSYADVVSPSIYLINYETSPFTNTYAYVDAQMAEAARLAPGKPIVPFIQPNYSTDGDMGGTISCVTTDNPAKVTTADTHNIQTADRVYVTRMSTQSNIENRALTVTRVDANNFTLNGIAGSTILGAVASASCGTYAAGGTYQASVRADQMRAFLERLDNYTDSAIYWTFSSTSGIPYSPDDPAWSEVKEYVRCE